MFTKENLTICKLNNISYNQTTPLYHYNKIHQIVQKKNKWKSLYTKKKAIEIIIEMKTKRKQSILERINEARNWLFEKSNRIDKSQASLVKKKKQNSPNHKYQK